MNKLEQWKANKIKAVIAQYVPDFRKQWADQLAPYSDQEIGALYEEYSLSLEYRELGNRNFPKWFHLLEPIDLPDHEPTMKELQR